MMTRENAKSKLVDMGIAEPTEEQITKYLDSITAETKKEKDRADSLKEKADKVDELQTQLDDLNSQNMSEMEKTKTELGKATQRIAELEREKSINNSRSMAMEKFKITAEQAAQVVKDDGSFDYDVLGHIISDKEKAAATAKEQEIAKGASNPGGGGNGGQELSKGAEMAQKYNQNYVVKV